MMQFLGLHYGPQHGRLRQFNGDVLQNLAGNAFDFRSFSVVFVAAIRTCAMLHAARQTFGVPRSVVSDLAALWEDDD